MTRLVPQSPDSAFLLAANYALLRRNEDAVKAFDLVTPTKPLSRQLVASGRLAYESMLDPKLRPQALAAMDALRKRDDLDPTPLTNLTQMYSLLGDKSRVLELLPGMCSSSPVVCSDLSLNPVFRPLRGEAEFRRLVKQYDTTQAN